MQRLTASKFTDSHISLAFGAQTVLFHGSSKPTHPERDEQLPTATEPGAVGRGCSQPTYQLLVKKQTPHPLLEVPPKRIGHDLPASTIGKLNKYLQAEVVSTSSGPCVAISECP